MQGNCKVEPSAESLGLSRSDLDSRKPGQCVLVTDEHVMSLTWQSLWLESLYIRYRSTSSSDKIALLACSGKGCNLWLTSVTLQGDSSQLPRLGGLAVAGGQVYAEGAVCCPTLPLLLQAASQPALQADFS
jgi:hypothetical protein